MSAKTYEMNTELLKSLIFQLSVPAIFVTVPFTVFSICVALEIEKMSFFSQAQYILVTLHSPTNTIMMVYFIKPYRKRLMEKLSYIGLVVTRQKTLSAPSSVLVSTSPQGQEICPAK